MTNTNETARQFLKIQDEIRELKNNYNFDCKFGFDCPCNTFDTLIDQVDECITTLRKHYHVK